VLAGALRRAAAVAGAAARAYEGATPAPPPAEPPASPRQGGSERGGSPPPPLALGGDEDCPTDADGRPRRKGRLEKTLEDELRTLAERRARILERLTAMQCGEESGEMVTEPAVPDMAPLAL
jgi:hypothetical protein